MYLFIFESIGTSELILIGIVALIFLGPRKLPQIARTVGKTMADLRNTTNEFKSTWQREVDFEEEAAALRTGDLPQAPTIDAAQQDNSILKETPVMKPEIAAMTREDFDRRLEETADAKAGGTAPDPTDLSDKRNWL